MLARPGALSEAYVAGQRRRYLGPLQLFFIANALFFAVQSFTHIDIFSSPLDSHLHHQDWSALGPAAGRGAARASGTRRSPPSRPDFDRAAMLNAKALIILMALAFAPLLPLLLPRRRRPFGAHAVFALHFYAFILLLLCVSLLLAEAQLLAGGGGLASPRGRYRPCRCSISPRCGAYLYLAAGALLRQSRGAARVAKSPCWPWRSARSRSATASPSS